jgi:hypothetical protein
MPDVNSEVARLTLLDETQLWEELGATVRSENLGMMPDEEDRANSDEEVGRWYFNRQLTNIKKIYCSENVAGIVEDREKREISNFVTTLIDVFAAYFGIVAGTIILIQIHKFGVDRFCAEA